MEPLDPMPWTATAPDMQSLAYQLAAEARYSAEIRAALIIAAAIISAGLVIAGAILLAS